MRHLKTIVKPLFTFGSLLIIYSCSTTRLIPDGEQLYTGMKQIEYTNDPADSVDGERRKIFREQSENVKEEVEAALAASPNGALLGSPYYRNPFNIGLWIWNAWSTEEHGLTHWLCKTFGDEPVLMSRVNPDLRAQVARGVLRKHGYFHGSVGWRILDNKHNSKKAKLAYNVSFGPLATLDSIDYVDFPAGPDTLIKQNVGEAEIQRGDPFDVSTLDAERTRVSQLLRNNGYYYYQPGYASYLADTLDNTPVDIRLQLADSLPEEVMKRWFIGRMSVKLRESMTERLTDSVKNSFLTVYYKGEKSPLRTRVLMRSIRMRKGEPYSYANYNETVNRINAGGLFSMTDYIFTPREDTLDVLIDCMFEKPYSFNVEGNVVNRTNGRMGPGLTIALVRRNAFRGGEKIELNLKGSYEWQSGHRVSGSSSTVDSYEYGGDISIDFPRLLIPRRKFDPGRRRKPFNPRRMNSDREYSTSVKLARNTLNRAGFFRLHTLSAEMTYNIQPQPNLRHEFSPLIVEYNHLANRTRDFDSIMRANPGLYMSMQDQLATKMRYTLSYQSPSSKRNPISADITLTEAGNMLSLAYMAAGKSWNEKEKELFKNPYSQFLKIRADMTKTWQRGEKSQIVGHLAAGVIWTYGNSDEAPYAEKFYVGGANSIRAFSVRSIGPGAYTAPDNRYSYFDQTGDILLQGNIEYRFPLFANLYGAAFLDCGNVWSLHDTDKLPDSKFDLSRLGEQLALGTGVGLRYDLEFLVLRVDWGIGLHVPYETGKKGYFNIPNFHDGQTLHLAVGYPF